MKRWVWQHRSVVLFALLWAGGARADSARATVTRPFLWKVQSGHATVYLFGSLHAARTDMYPLDDRVYKAFDESQKLVLEADISGEKVLGMAGQMLAKAMYPAGDSADKHLSKEVFDKLSAQSGKLGLPATQFKPWFSAMMLEAVELEAVGMGMQNGMELHFLARAPGRKPILELEGVNAQIELLDGLTDKEQEMFVTHTLQSLDKFGESLEQMLQAWKAGDDKLLDTFLTSSLKDAPDFAPVYKKLFEDRNLKMAEKIEGYLKTDETYFVVVGAGHLVGDKGLLQLLGKKYKVSRP